MKFWNWLKSLFTKKSTVVETPKPIDSKGWQQAWSDHLRKIINVEEFSKASDIKKLRPDWDELSVGGKLDALVEFFKALAYYESSYNPRCQTVDVGVKDNKSTWSIGLLQLSVIDQSNLNIRMGLDFETLQNPENNLSLGVAIMVNQIKKRGKIFIAKGEKGNPSAYWNPIIIGSKDDKIEKIIAAVNVNKEQKKDETLPTKPVSNETPWMTIVEAELGVSESKNPKRVIEYHQATTLKAKDVATPWCSSFCNWVLQQAGYKTTKSAWARDWLKYGDVADKQRGCIMVFERNAPGGDSHVGFYTGKETLTGYLVIGGNQSNQVCVKEYPKKDLLGCRWPV